MNKLFTSIAVASLSLTMAVGVGVAVGQSSKQEATQVSAATETVTITSSNCGWTTTQGSQSGTVSGITISTSSGVLNGTQLRVYKNNTFTVSSTVGNITAVEITCTASGTDQYGPGCFADVTSGTYSYSGKKGTWTGDASSFTITAKTNQVRMTNIVITYSGSETTINPTALSISDMQTNPGQTVDVLSAVTFTPTNTSPSARGLTLSSSDSSVFTVNSSNGTITGVGAGTATLTVTSTAVSTVSTNCTVTVSDYPSITLVTVDKEYSLVASVNEGNYELTGVSSNYGTASSYASTPSFGYTLTVENGSYPNTVALLTSDGNYLALTSAANALHTESSATANSSWSIYEENGNVRIRNIAFYSYYLSFNYNNGAPRFACYANTNQTAPSFYESISDPYISVDGETSVFVNGSSTLIATKNNGATGTINWTTSDATIVSLSSATGDQITISGEGFGVATLTASLTGCDDVVLNITVLYDTETTPYTIVQAKAAVDAGIGITKVYTHGIVSQIDSIDTTTYGNATYWISDDGTTANQLEVYRGKYLNNESFTSEDQLQLGDEVTVYGSLTLYNSTYEYTSGNYITSIYRERNLVSISGIDGTLTANSGDSAWNLSQLTPKGVLSDSSATVDISDFVTLSTNDVPGTVSEETTRNVSITVTPIDPNSGISAATFDITATITTYTGDLANGRYYIMNSDKTYGLSAEPASSKPAAVSLETNNSLIAFDFALKGNNLYEISTRVSGVKYYLVNNSTATSGSNSSVGIIAEPLSTLTSLYWSLDNSSVQTEGAYHVKENTTGTTFRYLSCYSNQDWRGYVNTDNGDPEIQFVAEGTYAELVADKILESCVNRGSSSYDATAWGNASSAYAAITIEAEKNFLINGSAVKDSTVKLERALEQYDYAVSRYEGIDAFITGRTGIYGLANNASLFAGISTEATTAIIVVVALTSVTAIGAIFFIKRRKYN
jgi:hypothetical protein